MTKRIVLIGASAVAVLTLMLACGGPPPNGAAQPQAPVDVTATPGLGFVTVTWRHDGGGVTGFIVYRSVVDVETAWTTGSAQSGAYTPAVSNGDSSLPAEVHPLDFAPIGEVGLGERSYRDDGVVPGTAYRYAVAAKSPSGRVSAITAHVGAPVVPDPATDAEPRPPGTNPDPDRYGAIVVTDGSGNAVEGAEVRVKLKQVSGATSAISGGRGTTDADGVAVFLDFDSETFLSPGTFEVFVTASYPLGSDVAGVVFTLEGVALPGTVTVDPERDGLVDLHVTIRDDGVLGDTMLRLGHPALFSPRTTEMGGLVSVTEERSLVRVEPATYRYHAECSEVGRSFQVHGTLPVLAPASLELEVGDLPLSWVELDFRDPMAVPADRVLFLPQLRGISQDVMGLDGPLVRLSPDEYFGPSYVVAGDWVYGFGLPDHDLEIPGTRVVRTYGGALALEIKPEEVAYEPGQRVAFDGGLFDGFGRLITLASNEPPSRGHIDIVVRDPFGQNIFEIGAPLFFSLTNVEVGFDLDPHAPPGAYVVEATVETGPYQGTVRSSSQFTVASTPSASMELTVDTALAEGTSVSLPLRGSVDVTIDWGDGQRTTATSSGDVRHEYASDGVHVITIGGNLSHFGHGAATAPVNWEMLTGVTSWGDLGLTSLEGAFYGATNLMFVPADLPATVTDTSRMFSGATRFDHPIGTWDTSNVNTMERMFWNADAFDQPIGAWNTSSVSIMTSMFEGATAFNRDIGGWDTSKVTSMEGMFSGAGRFDQDLSNWCVVSVPDKPLGFALGAVSWARPRPIWGTCPDVERYVDCSVPTQWSEDVLAATTLPLACYVVPSDVLVSAVLRLLPGTVLEFETNAGLRIADGGSLRAEGTAAHPIRFSSRSGDPNGWRGVGIFSSSSENVLDHVIIENAGQIWSAINGINATNLYLGPAGRAAITNSTLRTAGNNGVGVTVAGQQSEFLAFAHNRFDANESAAMWVTSHQLGQIGTENVFDLDGNARQSAKHIRVTSDGELRASATWPAVDVPYRFLGNHFVDDVDAVITIAAGTTLEFDRHAGFAVNAGALRANGTSDAPVRFTSASGDRGSWRGVGIFSNSVDNVLDHAIIENAGQMWSAVNHSNATNLYVGPLGAAAITNSTFARAGNDGVGLHVGSGSTVLRTFANNAFDDNELAPMRITSVQLGSIGAGNVFSRNAHDGARHIRVASHGSLVSSAAWRALDVPYRFFGNHFVEDVEAVITIEPGTTLEFDTSAGFRVNAGALSAVGTNSDRIVFTSASGNPDDWRGVGIASNDSRNALDFVTIEKAGRTLSTINNFRATNLFVNGSSRVAVTNSAFNDSGGWGIWVEENGLVTNAEGTTIDPGTEGGNTFSGNVSGAVRLP